MPISASQNLTRYSYITLLPKVIQHPWENAFQKHSNLFLHTVRSAVSLFRMRISSLNPTNTGCKCQSTSTHAYHWASSEPGILWWQIGQYKNPVASIMNRCLYLSQKCDSGTGEKIQKKENCAKIAMLNVESLTGKSSEPANVLHKWCINVCALQETQWSGGKPREARLGIKMMIARERGANQSVISQRIHDLMTEEIQRYNDHLMKIVIITEKTRVHFFSAYAP